MAVTDDMFAVPLVGLTEMISRFHDRPHRKLAIAGRAPQAAAMQTMK
jgi:hypothetical protein